eukprot:g1711.t1
MAIKKEPGNTGDMKIKKELKADRVFYESLHEQRPGSLMAMEWCMLRGIFDNAKQKRTYALVQKMKTQMKQELKEKYKKSQGLGQKKTKKKDMSGVIYGLNGDSVDVSGVGGTMASETIGGASYL